MNSVQKKLVSSIYKLWEAAQADENLKFYSQEIQGIGYVVATPHVLIRVPLDCPHPFKSSCESVRNPMALQDLIADKATAETAFDIGVIKTVNRNTIVKSIAYGTESGAVFVDKALWSYVPASVKYIDVYNNWVVRVYVEGEKLPVVIIASIQEGGDKQ